MIIVVPPPLSWKQRSFLNAVNATWIVGLNHHSTDTNKIVARVSNRRSVVETLLFTLLWVYCYSHLTTPLLSRRAPSAYAHARCDRRCSVWSRHQILVLKEAREFPRAFGCFVGADI